MKGYKTAFPLAFLHLGLPICLLISYNQALAQSAYKGSIILATTTSTQDSGLLDVLIPIFERQSGYRVKTIALGSGQSLAMGARGDVDVVLAHAPTMERKYHAEGFFINRRLVMYNDFVVVGPPEDPARIKGLSSVREVFSRLAAAKGPFISRADKSGTHLLELELWELAGKRPEGRWYIQVGQGMGATLNVASERGGYALTDRGTFLALKKRLHLEVLYEKDRALLNIYHVMEVNPAKLSKVNHAGAGSFGNFLLSPEAQAMIANFGVNKFGQPLFFPAAGKKENELSR